MAVILGTGALMFMAYEPEKDHSVARAVYFTWLLVFGENPEPFPTSPVLRVMFFATARAGASPNTFKYS